MVSILTNPRFAEAYARLADVSLDPRRHTAENARTHSDAVAELAARLAVANGCSADEVQLLTNLGHAHDIGKILGAARPALSLEVLAECGAEEPRLLSLVKWHDTALPWHKAQQRGEPPSSKAWCKLAAEVDLRLLGLFMVADRVDAPGGWRRNAPTPWFLGQARARGLVDELVLDVDDHPSEVSAGAALVRSDGGGPEVLVIRVRADGFELPKGGLEWNELPVAAAIRELREESGLDGELHGGAALGQLDYFVGSGTERYLKRVVYYSVLAQGELTLGPLPGRTRERQWLAADDVARVPLIDGRLRPILQAALDLTSARAPR